VARDRSQTRVAHATPSLGAVTWQRLAWAVEDRLGGSAGTSSELRVARDPEHLARLRAMEPTSAMIVPLASRGRTLGGLALVATRHSGHRYTRDDLALASELARRVGIGLERRAQQELVRRAFREQVTLVR
jgi:GAF domain-containing protein